MMVQKFRAQSVHGEEVQFDVMDLIAVKGEKPEGVFCVQGISCLIGSVEEVQENSSLGKTTLIHPPEKERIYHFPNGDRVLKNVCELIIRPSGQHRLKTTDGKHHIIPQGWLEIELDIEQWTN